jgi:hypothetical protein
MRFPWANTALLILLAIQLVSGLIGFVNGFATRAWVLWLHGAGAYALVLLLFWKGGVIWETMRRRKTWTRSRIGFLFLLILLLITLLLGLVWSLYGPQYLFGFSFLSLHIYLAIPLMILLAVHAWRMRWIWRLPDSRDRRTFLRTGLVGITGAAFWWLSGRVATATPLTNDEQRFTGSYETGSFTGRFPVTSWIADNPAPVQPEGWQLTVAGAVAKTAQLSYAQVLELADTQIEATLDCTGGFYTTQLWRGIPLDNLLNQAGIKDRARSISVLSITGYQRRFTIPHARQLLLATHVAGEPLTHGHGFPLRLVVPTGRGYTWVKWVTRLQVHTTSAIWQPPLPLQ